MANLKPMLFTSMKNYDKKQFGKDVVSGIIVAIIALPLSIALALASGVGPEQGIYTAIVAGFLISFFGGSTVQIAGPTAAFATIVAGIVARSGMEGLIVATVLAGLMLIFMGIFRFGALIKFIPYTITTGFTAGIAVTIVIGQLKDFMGITYDEGMKPIETLEKLECLVKCFDTVNVSAVIVGLVCVAVLILWPKINDAIPGSIIAIVVGVLMVKGLKMPVNTIGDLYSISNSLPKFSMMSFDIDLIITMLPDALTIAVLAAIESLLSCVVADGMVNTKHNSNMELVAQGIGNIGSALFGGIPATGAIARTAANIKSGGRTPVAGMVHSITLVLVLVILMPYAAWIPMPTIAAILFIVAYNMCQYEPFIRLLKTAPKSDIVVLVSTFILTIVFDLVVAIEFGMICACLLFIKRMSEVTTVDSWTYTDEFVDDLRPVAPGICVYEINGPMFFGAADKIADIVLKHDTKCLVLRMRSVPAVDATALKALEEMHDHCEKRGITVVYSHVNEHPMKTMKKAGLVEKIGEENFRPNINSALNWAERIVKQKMEAQ